MAQVNGWTDWLLWPLRTRFGTRAGAPPARDLGLDEQGRPWLYDEANFCRFSRAFMRNPKDGWLLEFETLPAGLPRGGFALGSSGDPDRGLYVLEGRHAKFRKLRLEKHGFKPSETLQAMAELERKQGLDAELEANPKVAVFPGR